MKQLLFVFLLASPAFAQLPTVNYAAMFFQSSKLVPAVRTVSSLPATCTAAGSGSSSNAVLYQGRVYQCTATNTWTFAVGQSAALTAGRLPYVVTGGGLADNANATLDSSGKLSLGVPATTAEKLNINGNIYTQGTFPYFQMFSTSSGGGWNQSFYFQVGVNLAAASAGDYAVLMAPSNRGISLNAGSTPRLTAFVTTGNVGVNTSTTDPSAQFAVYSSSSSKIAGVFRAASSATTDIVQMQNNLGTVLSALDASGRFYAPTALTQSTVGAAGGASALPATPSGYLKVNINGTERIIPYYPAS